MKSKTLSLLISTTLLLASAKAQTSAPLSVETLHQQLQNSPYKLKLESETTTLRDKRSNDIDASGTELTTGLAYKEFTFAPVWMVVNGGKSADNYLENLTLRHDRYGILQESRDGLNLGTSLRLYLRPDDQSRDNAEMYGQYGNTSFRAYADRKLSERWTLKNESKLDLLRYNDKEKRNAYVAEIKFIPTYALTRSLELGVEGIYFRNQIFNDYEIKDYDFGNSKVNPYALYRTSDKLFFSSKLISELSKGHDQRALTRTNLQGELKADYQYSRQFGGALIGTVDLHKKRTSFSRNLANESLKLELDLRWNVF